MFVHINPSIENLNIVSQISSKPLSSLSGLIFKIKDLYPCFLVNSSCLSFSGLIKFTSSCFASNDLKPSVLGEETFIAI